MNTLLGLCTRPVISLRQAWWALPLRILTVHLPNGFSSIKLLGVTSAGAHFGQPGYETDLLYCACLAALVLGGSGPFALDSVLPRRSRDEPRGASEPTVRHPTSPPNHQCTGHQPGPGLPVANR